MSRDVAAVAVAIATVAASSGLGQRLRVVGPEDYERSEVGPV